MEGGSGGGSGRGGGGGNTAGAGGGSGSTGGGDGGDVAVFSHRAPSTPAANSGCSASLSPSLQISLRSPILSLANGSSPASHRGGGERLSIYGPRRQRGAVMRADHDVGTSTCRGSMQYAPPQQRREQRREQQQQQQHPQPPRPPQPAHAAGSRQISGGPSGSGSSFITTPPPPQASGPASAVTAWSSSATAPRTPGNRKERLGNIANVRENIATAGSKPRRQCLSHRRRSQPESR